LALPTNTCKKDGGISLTVKKKAGKENVIIEEQGDPSGGPSRSDTVPRRE